jgi:hypothetical protein
MTTETPIDQLTIAESDESSQMNFHSKIASRFYKDSKGNNKRVVQTNDQIEQIRGIARIENVLFEKLAKINSKAYQLMCKADQQKLEKEIESDKLAYSTFLIKRERGLEKT